MCKNYFKTAWRNLVKNKFYSSINILGLAIGLAVGIMVLMWVRDELSYDTMHRNAADIYKINSHIGTGSSEQVWEGSPAPLLIFAKQSIPEVVNAVRVKKRYEQLLFKYADKKIIEGNAGFVDSTFFTLFDFKLLQGNPQKPFNDINSVILTQSTAKKFFGEQDPMGKVLVQDKENFVVTGVAADIPENSSIKFNMFFSMGYFGKQFTAWGGNGDWKTMDEDLGNYQYDLFLQIRKDASADLAAKKLTQIFRDHRKGDNVSHSSFSAQPLKSMHLVTASGNAGARQTVNIFLLVAVLILFIACINYVNLSTARSMVRSREVSVRKIIGAARLQLFIQFIIESAVLFLIASIFSFVIIYVLLPLYNSISGKHLVFNLANGDLWLVIGLSICGVLIMGSIYPAILLSSFKPLQALKGKIAPGVGNASFRRILVVVQFVLSVGLIIGTLVIRSQLQYIREKDLGYDKDHVFAFGLSDQLRDHYDAARNDLLKQPGVLDVASSNNGMAGVNGSTSDTHWEGKEADRTFMVHPNGIDQRLIPLLKMKLVAGANFTGAKSDSAHFIVNETLVKQAGIKDPVGKTFTLWQNTGTIIGVVKDFNYASLKDAIEPAIFYYSAPGWAMYIKTTGKDASKAIAAAQNLWTAYSPDYPFKYSFLDDDFNHMYESEQRTGTLFNVFAAVAIIISCLGLFGLATFTAQVKTKEIGIRKVLGASIFSITQMLAKDFIVLVLISFIIAAPLAWWFTHKWLQDFIYRVNLSIWVFVLAGFFAVLIALLTISFQSIKAALANPVRSLRSE